MIESNSGKQYRLVERIGFGGSSTVHKGVRENSVTPRAIKIARLPEHNEILKHEAEIMRGLRHPHVMPLLDQGITPDGAPFLVMPFAQRSLGDVATNPHRPQLADTVRILEAAASGLEHMHQKGLVHIDVKPANILLEGDGKKERVRVSDFSVTRKTHGDTFFTDRLHERTFGSLPYKDPARLERDRPLDPSPLEDVYGLAATAFEVVTGQPPFSGLNDDILRDNVLFEPPRSFRELVPGTQMNDEFTAVEGVVLRGLEKKPKNRPKSAAAFGAELREAYQKAHAKVKKQRKIIT